MAAVRECINKLTLYRQHSHYSDISQFDQNKLHKLPNCPYALFEIAQHLAVHEAECQLGNYQFANNRQQEVYLRDAMSMLTTINNLAYISWSTKRKLSEKLITTCRGASLLYVALLRQMQIPARLRVGFINYHPIAAFNMDHVIVEFYDHNTSTWCWADVLLTEAFKRRNPTAKHINACQLNDHQFIPAETAWNYVRNKSVPTTDFAIGLFQNRRGLFAIRNKLLHELAARLTLEMLPGDLWGYMLFDGPTVAPTDNQQLNAFDAIASALSADNTTALQQLYNTDPGLRIPSIVLSHKGTMGMVACDIGRITCQLM